jgi:hypothetical protein
LADFNLFFTPDVAFLVQNSGHAQNIVGKTSEVCFLIHFNNLSTPDRYIRLVGFACPRLYVAKKPTRQITEKFGENLGR